MLTCYQKSDESEIPPEASEIQTLLKCWGGDGGRWFIPSNNLWWHRNSDVIKLFLLPYQSKKDLTLLLYDFIRNGGTDKVTTGNFVRRVVWARLMSIIDTERVTVSSIRNFPGTDNNGWLPPFPPVLSTFFLSIFFSPYYIIAKHIAWGRLITQHASFDYNAFHSLIHNNVQHHSLHTKHIGQRYSKKTKTKKHPLR